MELKRLDSWVEYQKRKGDRLNQKLIGISKKELKNFFIRYVGMNNFFDKKFPGGITDNNFSLYSLKRMMDLEYSKNIWEEYETLKSINPDIEYIIVDHMYNNWDENSPDYTKYLILDIKGNTTEITDKPSLDIIKKFIDRKGAQGPLLHFNEHSWKEKISKISDQQNKLFNDINT